MSKDNKTKYVWVSEGGKNSCSECDALDGQEFDDEADGLHEYHDEATYTAIKEFQKDNELIVDGKIKPDGETIEKINESLLKMASLSVAGMQGLSLGFSDELHGAAGAVGYGIFNIRYIRDASNENNFS